MVTNRAPEESDDCHDSSNCEECKQEYFRAVEEIVRRYEVHPAVSAARENGTIAEHSVQFLKDNPSLWDGWFVEAMAAALEKLDDERIAGSG